MDDHSSNCRVIVKGGQKTKQYVYGQGQTIGTTVQYMHLPTNLYLPMEACLGTFLDMIGMDGLIASLLKQFLGLMIMKHSNI